MPIEVRRLLCSVCKTEFRVYNDAMNCEMLPLQVDPAVHEIGDTVSYEDESSMFGSRYSYSTSSGIVLFKYIGRHVPNDGQNIKHVTIYVVDGRHSENEAVYILDDLGIVRLVSMAEWKFQKGYAERIKQQLMFPT